MYEKYILRNPIVTKNNNSSIYISREKFSLGDMAARFPISVRTITVSKPRVINIKNVVHDYDGLILFLGTNLLDHTTFGATVELFLGNEERHIIDTTSAVFIPKGLQYGPLSVLSVQTPISVMHLAIFPNIMKIPSGDSTDFFDQLSDDNMKEPQKGRSSSDTVQPIHSRGMNINIEDEIIKLRDLSSHLQAVREEERFFMAREIHDELGQILTTLNLDSSWVYSHLPDDQLQVKKKVQEMSELIESTIKTVKRISATLRPSLLDDLGIIAALEWQANNFQETTGITCNIYSDPVEINLDKVQSIAIFRIFQEALTNVARYANATRLQAEIVQRKGKVILTVQDNGIGITEDQIYAHGSLGIIGMSERVRSLGGELTIRGIHGKGTKVSAIIPLKK